MTQQASHKVPDGKMVKIKFRDEEGDVYDVEIRGDFFIEPPEKRVSRIKDHTDHSGDEVIDKLIQKFTEDKEHKEGGLTEEEIEEAKKRAQEKFSSEEWNRKL